MDKSILHIDYETRSYADLFRGGAFRYAADETTGIICLGWAFDDEDVEVWLSGQEFPQRVVDHINADLPRSLHAHNAQFERVITKYVLPKYIVIKQPSMAAWYCTAAQARARALPGALDDLGRCLGLQIQKDRRGKELIKLMCIPQMDDDGGKSIAEPTDELLNEMVEYCLRDVEVERIAEKATPPLSDSEQLDWVINEIVNDRGLKVDVEFARAASSYADAELAEIKERLTDITDGEITSPRQYTRIKEYMEPYMDDHDEIKRIMTRVEKNRKTGEEKVRIALDRSVRIKLLHLVEEHPDILPEHVVEMIELIDEAGRSSVAKYQNMVARAGEGDRVRGAYMFSGAGQTGRFSSIGLQVHNLPRKTASNPSATRASVISNDLEGNVMDTLSSMLRPSIIAEEGHRFVGGDWSSIEARILPWLSASVGGDGVLELYRGNDSDPGAPDVYMHAAADLYNIPAADITKEQRAVGKVIILSSGYQGGYRAFQAMARAYNIDIDDEVAGDIIHSWRAANPWAPDLWKGLERCAKDAVDNVGTVFTEGRLTYCQPDLKSPLYCQLPSGRMLSYPYPRLEVVEGKFGPDRVLTCIKASWKPAQGSDDWGRVQLYGGLLAENATQGAAACILRHALAVAEEDGWPVVGHTHDELILEVLQDEVGDAEPALAGVMLDTPAWADGLPMNCETWNGERYRK